MTYYLVKPALFKTSLHFKIKFQCRKLSPHISTGNANDEDADREQQRMVKGMKKELKSLISLPIFKNVMKTKYPTQMGKLPLPQMPLAGMESALTRVSTQKKPETSIHPRQKKQKQKAK